MNNGKKDKDIFFKINAITIYWSQNLIKKLNEKNQDNSYGYDFFVQLMTNLEKEDRDHLINSIINELRYPSVQTIFFSNLIVYLFEKINNPTIEEHLFKNIIERLLYKPFPWGVAFTFITLMKNDKELLSEKTYIKGSFEDILDKLLVNCSESSMNNYLSN